MEIYTVYVHMCIMLVYKIFSRRFVYNIQRFIECFLLHNLLSFFVTKYIGV